MSLRTVVDDAMRWARSWDDTEPLEDHDECVDTFMSDISKLTSFVEVSDQLVEQMNEKWSEPVEFQFHRLGARELDMSLRYTEEGLEIRRLRSALDAAWEAYLEGTPETLDRFECAYAETRP